MADQKAAYRIDGVLVRKYGSAPPVSTACGPIVPVGGGVDPGRPRDTYALPRCPGTATANIFCCSVKVVCPPSRPSITPRTVAVLVGSAMFLPSKETVSRVSWGLFVPSYWPSTTRGQAAVLLVLVSQAVLSAVAPRRRLARRGWVAGQVERPSWRGCREPAPASAHRGLLAVAVVSRQLGGFP